MPVTDIEQLRQLHEKYSALFSYIALLNAEIARRLAILEELRKNQEQQKKEPASNRLNGLNFHTVIIDEVTGTAEIGENRNEAKQRNH